MGFCQRIKQSNLTFLSQQIRRYYFKISDFTVINCPSANLMTHGFDSSSQVQRIRVNCSHNVRYFAAPIQALQKKEEKDYSGPRLNEEITAKYVRLVLEEGHFVVSIHEAFERARKLNLDLVEVQRHASPPVCKIMDFHKEQYKQVVKKKERLKSKSDVTLKSGDFKEVRFYGKTELKDLKVKSDMIQKLMERGYRVKCMAMASHRGRRSCVASGTDCGDDDDDEEEELMVRQKNRGEREDLGALLSRLTSMIGETAVVESGPWVEKKQAFVVVRHAKFGPAKKGKTKKLTDLQDAIASGKLEDADLKKPVSSENIVPIKSTWSEVDSTDDVVPVFDLGGDSVCSISERRRGFVENPPGSENRYKAKESLNRNPHLSPETYHRRDNRYQRSESHKINVMINQSSRDSNPNPPISSTLSFSNSERRRSFGGEDDCNPNLSPETYRRNENRYKKRESDEINAPMNPFSRDSKPDAPVSSPAVFSSSDRRGRVVEDHRGPHLPSETCRRTENRYSKSESNKIDTPIHSSPFRNTKLNSPIAPPPRYGIFSSPENAPAKLDAAAMNKHPGETSDNSPRDSSSSVRLRNSSNGGLPQSGGRPGQGRWGIFSGDR